MIRFFFALLGVFAVVVLAQAQAPFRFAADGAWCWFGNPRAVFKDGKIYYGYVRQSDGRACVSVFDPATTNAVLLLASTMAQKDDHNNPACLPLNDGRMLVTYEKHSAEQRFYFRVSTNSATDVAANWTPEAATTNSGASVSYSNPYQLAAETNRIFLFSRNLNYNPTLYLSDATGTNWTVPVIFIQTGSGSARPYVQYCSDGVSRIDVLYTDGHPGEMPASLYHLYYQSNALRQTDSAFLRSLANLPLLHDSGERGSVIYQFNTNASLDYNDWIPLGRAWCWDVVQHTNGAPVAAFTVQASKVAGTNWFDDRLYYYYARWTGTAWQKRFIAQAGRPLYNGQQHYAGGITIDPNNPDVVYLSSNAQNPFDLTSITNVPLRANSRYEIWRGVTSDGGLTFNWQAVTTNSTIDNLRPVVPRVNTHPFALVWFAGTYVSYTSWSAAMLGWVGTNLPLFTVTPNNPPAVNLLKPQSGALLLTNISNHLRLQASATDDGQPGPLSLNWSTVSGPTNAVFANAAAADTDVSFSVAGTYDLRLTAHDTELTNFAGLTVNAGIAAPATNDPTLALWLKFDESSGTLAADSSGNTNNGAVVGGATWLPTGGVRQGAVSVNGSNAFVSVADAPLLDNTAAFTLAFWFRASSYNSAGAGLVSKRNAISDNNAYTTYLLTDRLIYVDVDGNGNRFSSATTFDTNRWYHLALTFNGSLASTQRVRLYVDGALDRIATETSATLPNYNSTVKIGVTHSNATTWFDGAFDDVRFYRRALAVSEIAALISLKSAPAIASGSAPAATNGVPANLAGSATSDGSGGPLTTWWSAVPGPGPAWFAASNNPATSVTFSNAGNFTLRLSASDTNAEVFNDLAVSVVPSATPPLLACQQPTASTIQLTWPADHTGWRLETQTNSRSLGLRTNWFTVPGSTVSNSSILPIDPASPLVFFRLTFP